MRRKSFTAIRPLMQAAFISADFVALAKQAFVALDPLNAYLRQVVEFEAYVSEHI